MPKQTDLPLETISIRLYEGDKDVLRQFYPEIGYNAAIRELVHKHVAKLRERLNRQQGYQSDAAFNSTLDINALLGTGTGGSNADPSGDDD